MGSQECRRDPCDSGASDLEAPPRAQWLPTTRSCAGNRNDAQLTARMSIVVERRVWQKLVLWNLKTGIPLFMMKFQNRGVPHSEEDCGSGS